MEERVSYIMVSPAAAVNEQNHAFHSESRVQEEWVRLSAAIVIG